MIRYEIGEPSFDHFTQTTTVKIVMTWPYGEPTPPLLHSSQVIHLNSKKYIVSGFEYEPAVDPGEEHAVTYFAHPKESEVFERWDD